MMHIQLKTSQIESLNNAVCTGMSTKKKPKSKFLLSFSEYFLSFSEVCASIRSSVTSTNSHIKEVLYGANEASKPNGAAVELHYKYAH